MNEYLQKILRESLHEDLLEAGDLTSKAIFASNHSTSALIRVKEECVISGVYLLEPLFNMLDSNTEIDPAATDGARLRAGDAVCRLRGPIQTILAGERTALNFLQRLSGIASLTARFVEQIKGTRARILDTRKTTPLLRGLEKRAVLHGGGMNHRFGLYDMILIKDTHVKAAGGPAAAVAAAKEHRPSANIRIEVEIQSMDEFHDALTDAPDRIMLDNMSVNQMKTCVETVRHRQLLIELEASGNVRLDTIGQIAQTGVDFISVGALTHSAPAVDIHLVLL